MCVLKPCSASLRGGILLLALAAIFETAYTTTSEWNRPPSAFPTCRGNGTFVPAILCSGGKGTKKTCCIPSKTQKLIPHSKAAILANMQCGVPGKVKQLQSGTHAQPGEFPWMALVEITKTKSVLFCDGTPIHPRYVLTAANCISSYTIRQLKVSLGRHDLRQGSKCPTPSKCQIPVAKKFTRQGHDIGLLRLSKSAALIAGVVQPICLPIYDHLRVHLPARLAVSGWGMYDGQKHYSLQKTNMQVLQRPSGCEIVNSFCAGGNSSTNHCVGDTGGPLQARDIYGSDVRYVQYGVYSARQRNCENPSKPSKGMLVGYYMTWILNKMKLS
ncbi:AGAP001648-PA-like protein [Anopheles sinensis]|uniref:AGAP001648-PA-like protein n=1 Tax=Anopheles sinensis TaxID=74873 RepID=A0A084WB17_ANOSI|nr:AGAP001648-PA-like protein [Anopheles sinensis]